MTFAWLGTAIALMAVGFVILDLLTPGCAPRCRRT